MTEFKTLSEKIETFPAGAKMIYVEDVKKFIRIITEDMIVPTEGDRVGFVINEFNRRIRKFAGGKLI